MPILPRLEESLRRCGAAAGDGLVVALSGGADSTALLRGLWLLRSRLGLRLVAAHLDHGLDGGSAKRARAAARLAGELEIPFVIERADDLRGPDGLEAASRRARYAFLERVRRAQVCRWIATAHHRDDQSETVLLRMVFGSGPLGLGGVQARRGALIRPLLGFTRAELRAFLEAGGIPWVEDPGNRDLARPRNRLRHAVLPRLQEETPAAAVALASLADAARAAVPRLEALLGAHVDLRGGPPPRLDASRLRALPEPLQRPALDALHRRAGAPYPAPGRAASELLRQLSSGAAVGCDCGDGRRWLTEGNDLLLVEAPRGEAPARNEEPLFTYTLTLPGELEVEELQLRFRMGPSGVRPWMFRASSHRVGLALPLEPGDKVTIRNRRPGDRMRPFGWGRNCRLKNLFINRRVPRALRNRLPLLCCDRDIAWIPGVATHDRFRIGSHERVWVAEVESLAPSRTIH